MSRGDPPFVSRLLLKALLPREEAEFILGDLEEDFQAVWR